MRKWPLREGGRGFSGLPPSVGSIDTVSLENWLTPPYNREAFWRVRDLAPTKPIRNGSERVHRLTERPANLDDIHVPSVDADSRETLSEHLRRTNCDGLCVVRDGVVRYEWRPRGVAGAFQSAAEDPASRHLLMSVSKSLCATVLGAAVGRGDVSLDDRVVDVAPEFVDTSVADATVRHLIDMTSGTDFVEDYASYTQPDSDIQVIDYERQANFRPLAGRTPIGVLAHFRSYGLAREHGSWFDYRSPLTNIVAACCSVQRDMTMRRCCPATCGNQSGLSIRRTSSLIRRASRLPKRESVVHSATSRAWEWRTSTMVQSVTHELFRKSGSGTVSPSIVSPTMPSRRHQRTNYEMMRRGHPARIATRGGSSSQNRS
ncbi:MAG: class C beta-lactamase-related serine hydrolase [Actinobacteria bacterium]|nr:class C beta-lactamase-related serine hydrolase [Actinomycetota bacterium]